MVARLCVVLICATFGLMAAGCGEPASNSEPPSTAVAPVETTTRTMARPSNAHAVNRTGNGRLEISAAGRAGAPASGARISIELFDWNVDEPPHVQTFALERMAGEDGAVLFEGLPAGAYGIVGLAPDAMGIDSAYLAEDGEAATTVSVEEPLHLIEGRVVRAGGSAVGDAWVLPYTRDGEVVPDAWGNALRARTGDDGRFTIRLPGGDAWSFYVRSDETASYLSESVAVTGDDVQFVLGRGGRVSGVVVDGETGEPLSGAPVVLASSCARDGFRTESDSEGRFQFRRVRPATFRVAIDDPAYRPGQGDPVIDVAEGQAVEGIRLVAFP